MWCLYPLAGFVLAIALHAVVARLRPAGNRVSQFLAAGLIAGLGPVLLPLGSNVGIPAWAAGILGYAFACELYIFLFTFVTSSISVSILVSRLDAPPGDISLAPSTMVEQRLLTMTAAGLLRHESTQFVLTPKSRRLLWCYRALRSFFRHPAESSHGLAPPPKS
jgi:hypothetical protein